ncbi:MAG: hypothetical protein RLZZ616_510 [Pseudomonadota bacterium]|jgi:starvation-inducible outer membrane lipoprotein|uniref:hypothetical protein n=1 Tax=Aeromonas popoffii TaxID=70856 RepID=UPI0005A991F7|nr:hypothetical protein [Aeromonas popoffii]
MKILLPLFTLLLTACSSGPDTLLMEIDDDAWQAICKDGTQVQALVEEGICAEHGGVASWTNQPRGERIVDDAANPCDPDAIK